MKCSAVLGKSRWVENDEVVAVAHSVEILKGILTESLMAGVAGEIHFHISCGEFYCLSATIDRMHQFGTSAHGIEREAAGVAEHVKHLLAMGETLKQRTVFTLVDEETCLLTL